LSGSIENPNKKLKTQTKHEIKIGNPKRKKKIFFRLNLGNPNENSEHPKKK
jgi:hypothetical protein